LPDLNNRLHTIKEFTEDLIKETSKVQDTLRAKSRQPQTSYLIKRPQAPKSGISEIISDSSIEILSEKKGYVPQR